MEGALAQTHRNPVVLRSQNEPPTAQVLRGIFCGRLPQITRLNPRATARLRLMVALSTSRMVTVGCLWRGSGAASDLYGATVVLQDGAAGIANESANRRQIEDAVRGPQHRFERA